MTIHDIYRRISPHFRRRRLEWFRRRVSLAPAECILDVGGNPWFWTESGLANPITLLNLDFPPALAAEYPQYRLVRGDGCRLAAADGEFDVVFSNSVIEHVGTWERQQAFAAEARRAGRKLWVQTPAREFFMEPHLIAPFVHWLPAGWRRRLIRNFTVWGWLTRPDPAAIEGFLAEVRLLNRSEMAALFPDCEILTERFLGLAKSHIAVRRS